MYVDRQTIMIGAGAGIGVVQTFAFREYLDQYPIPGIGGFIPSPWNRWSTFGNILIGAVALGVTSFTGVLNRKNPTLNKIVWTYGLTVLLGGILNGVWPKNGGLRAVARQAQTFRAAAPAMNNGIYPTPTGIPYAKILA